MFGVGVRRPENTTLLGGSNYTCHIKSQSFKIAYDKAIITKWSIGKMGHIALPIWDAIPATKSCEGTGGDRFLGWASRPTGNQTLWRSPRWGRWSLLDPDIFRKIGVATLLRRASRTGPRENIVAGVGVVLVSPQNYVISCAFSLTESCSNNVAD